MTQASLLFDLDGTLIDSARVIAMALSALTGGEMDVTPRRVRPLVSQGVETMVRSILRSTDARLHEDISEFRRQLIQLHGDPADLYPGVEECISSLSARGYQIAIVTNKPEALARKLISDVGLEMHFAAIIGGDTCRVSKPDPLPLRHALEMLGSSTNNAVMIGDSAVDAKAAAACRMQFVLFESGYGASECHDQPVWARFDHYHGLPPILDLLNAE